MLPPLADRRERGVLILRGFSVRVMLNIIGITRFVELGPMSLAVGVLPTPLPSSSRISSPSSTAGPAPTSWCG